MAYFNYEDFTNEDFIKTLAHVMDGDNTRPSQLLLINGVYEILKEHYNNDILTLFDCYMEYRKEETTCPLTLEQWLKWIEPYNVHVKK